MRLIKCYVEGFGKLNQFSYNFDEGMNVILEDNGFGKTTLAAFLKAMFYGLANTGKTSVIINERKRYKPWQGGNFGGNVLFEQDGKRYLIERFFGEKDKDETFILYDARTNLVSHDYSQNIGEELFLLDREAFERSVYMPQLKLETTGNDSISAKLANLAHNDNDMNRYEKALASLEDKKKELIKTGEKGRIWDLRHLISKLEYKLKEAEASQQNFQLWQEKRKEVKEEIIQIDGRLDALQKELKIAGEYEKKKAKFEHYDTLKKTLAMYEKKLREQLEFFPEEMCDEIPDKQVTDAYFDKTDKINEYNANMLAEQVRVESVNSQKEVANEQYLQLQKKYEEEVNLQNSDVTKVRNWSGLIIVECIIAVVAVVIALMSLLPGLILLFVAVVAIAVTILHSRSKKNELEAIHREQQRRQQELRLEVEAAKATLDRLTEESLQAAKRYETYADAQKELLHSVHEFISRFPAYTQIESNQFAVALSEINEKIAGYNNLKDEVLRQKAAIGVFERENNISELEKKEEVTKPLEVLQGEERALISKKQQLMEQSTRIDRQIENLSDIIEQKEDDVSELEHVRHELTELEKQYELLDIAITYLQKAKDSFSMRYLDKMRDSFQSYMSLLNGDIVGESVLDTKLKLKITQAGSKKELDCFSAGYKDLMNLCMRFALVDALYEKEKPFLILDDPFVNLDKAKIANALEFINKLSEKYQILYLSCHESRR